MAEFTGFQPDHFHYFLMHDDDDDRQWVREQLDSFACQVLTGLRAFEPFYERHEVGQLRLADSSCWVAFGPRHPEYRNVTHQTVSLRSDGLRVFVNTELKSATDRLKNVLMRSECEFREALQHLHELGPFELVLEERIQRQASLYDYTPKMRMHSSMLVEATGDVAWKAFTQTVNRLPLPYLRIERLVPAAKLIELSKCDEAVRYVVRNPKAESRSSTSVERCAAYGPETAFEEIAQRSPNRIATDESACINRSSPKCSEPALATRSASVRTAPDADRSIEPSPFRS